MAMDLLNMTQEESIELIVALEREQRLLQSAADSSIPAENAPARDRRLELVKSLLWKAKSVSSASVFLDPSELIHSRLAGYC